VIAGWTTDDVPDQAGRTILITGASSGLGLASAEILAARGARVLLVCRSRERGSAALERVRGMAVGPAPELLLIDLASLDSVRAGGRELADRVESLDVVMNNAGVMLQPRGWTADGLETHMASNHFGHFALTALLLPALSRSSAPRVVSVSSLALWIGRMRWSDLQARSGRYSKWLAYGQSKLANYLFMLGLARRAREAASPLVSVGAHPGGVHTNLVAHSPSGNFLEHKVLGRFFQEPTEGTRPQLYAATMEVRSGDWFGPRGPGPFEIGGPPQPARRRRVRLSDVERLWSISEDITGVPFVWRGQ
jgi:protochlorophyllide reductase